MWRILQHPVPEDFVLATGVAHSVRELVTIAFREAGFQIRWQGEGPEEVGIDSDSGDVLIEVDPRYFRPTEVDCLVGDPGKAREKLGWHHSTSFEDMIGEMVASDLEVMSRGENWQSNAG
jgi:GDPmannose 4,6-dehydratase